jgi:hypothetical protein
MMEAHVYWPSQHAALLPTHFSGGAATSLNCLLISSRCGVISDDRVHGYMPQLLADFLTL